MNNNLSLITTVYNEASNIGRFLGSYLIQSLYADEFIIVDGGSSDGTIEEISAFSQCHPQLNIRLIVDETCSLKNVKGPIARGRNVAIGNASHENILVTDAGCVLNSNWLENISRPLVDGDCEVVSGWFEAIVDTPFQKLYEQLYMPKLSDINPNNLLPSSRSIAFKRQCWEQVGGYPEQTYTAEDTVFDISMKKAGFEFLFVSAAVVYWDCPRSSQEVLKKYYQYALGDGYYKLFKLRYLYLLMMLFIPVNIIFNKNKRKNIKLVYKVTFYRVKGYILGLSRTK